MNPYASRTRPWFAIFLTLCASLTAARADSVVVFNEIQYHPADPGGAEWIELHNQMSYDVDLSRWKLRGGVDFDFPEGTVIPASGYLLVSDIPGAVGGAIPPQGPWAGSLANGGERLRLRNNSDRLMDEVEYHDSGAWPVGPDGSGATLAKADESSFSGDAANWRSSAQIGGTPGAANFPSETSIGPPVVIVPIGASWRYDESGSDPGAGWAADPHPGWPAGDGLFGFETTPADLPAPLGTVFEDPADNDILTYYFEIDFELTAEQLAQIDTLSLRHVIDDGAVFYLNGVEAGPRFNMAAGTPSAATPASGGVGNAAFQGPFSLPTSALVAGTNRLSAEVHQQSAGSSDIVFGAELSLTLVIPPPSATSAPLVISEIAGSGDADFRIEIANTSSTSFDAGGYLIESRGAVDAGFAIPPGTLIAGGGFLVIPEAELGFRPADGDRLFLISPAGAQQFLVHAARADELPRARSAAHHGRMLVPDAPTFGAPNSFAINDDIVINEIMYHFRDDPGSDGSGAAVTLIPIGATWRYNESGADLGADWQNTAHPADNINWSSGPALLGSETTPDAMPEPLRTEFAPSADNDIITYYFETEFTLSAAQLAEVSALRLRHVVDDGAIFYLNGVEIERFNLPDGPVGAATTASPGVPNAVYQGPIDLPVGSLVAGSNRLSVEVHQQSPGSSDVIFGAELVAVALVPPVPVVERDEEWVELFNRGGAPVDLTGWSIGGGIGFEFPSGSSIEPGGFLVVAGDAAALRAKHASVATAIIGNFSGGLGNAGDTLRLEDALGNPVDELRYYDGGRWPALADGDGSSLELRDPHADNSNPQAWAASDETGKSTWQEIRYRDNGAQSYGLTNWNEFRLGMLGAAELLIDDVSVVRDPDGARQELIQNGSFSGGADKWRAIGNHRHSAAIPEPGNAGNMVLHLVSSGATDTRHNHLETTFVNNTALVASQTYEVSFRARWLSGSNAINSRCYYQRAALTTQLARPEACGTPGAANSRLVANIGPTFEHLRHDPPVPAAKQAIAVTADVADPDGLGAFSLKARIDEGPVQSFDFIVGAGGHGVGYLPGQSAGSVIQFWIEAADALGAQSTAPAAGADSRALIQVADGQGTSLAVPEVRLIMLGSEREFMLGSLNLMSNERIGCTAIYDGSEIFYDAAVRLRGSGAGRARDGDAYRGFNIGLPADQKFRGVHDSLSIDRSARTPVARQQHEIYVKHMFNHAGIPCMYDELIYLVGPSPNYTGTSQMLMAGYGGLFAESQFDNGDKGTVFNLDITYDPVSSIGGVEGSKPPVPFTHVGTDMRDLGDSEEDYRTAFEIRTGRGRDDYSGLIRFCKTMSLPSAQLEAEIGTSMDVDEWCRYTAMVLLCGIGDTFVTGGLPHNIRLFVPEDGRGVAALPWDMDFVFSSGTSASMLPGGGNLPRVLAIPKYRRLYWGHVQDLVNTTFNATYMGPWLAHYGSVVNQGFSGQAGYISSRGSFALSQLPAQVPFNITSNGGGDFSIDATSATLEGQGWINIREFRLAGSSEALASEWLDGDTWRVTVPLRAGVNAIVLETYDFQGGLLDTRALTITSTVTTPTPAEFLRITEIHYNPAPPVTAAELLVSTNGDDFEFIEFHNIGTEPLQLGGVHFTEGIDFTFPAGSAIPGGGYVVAVRNRAAFEARYGAGLPVAGEFSTTNLRNSGELLDLRDAPGNIIHRFSYGDSVWYPATDGGGYSLHIREAATSDLSTWGDPVAWQVSTDLHGNPGRGNSSSAPTLASWQAQHFTEAERNDPAISGPLVDLNQDGTPNLLKYAFGISPHTPAPPGTMPSVAAQGERLEITFRRQAGAADLEYLPQASSDLNTWTTLTRQIGPPIDNGDGTETVTFQDDDLAGDHAKRFARLRVNLLGL